MKKGIFTLIKNEELIPGFHRLSFAGDASAVTRPGMFAEVQIPGYFLRRPFSVADACGDSLTLAVRVRGEGTAVLTAMPVGSKLDILTGLGNGFDLDCAGERPLLVGGGSGVPALYMACRELIERGASPIAALGFNSAYPNGLPLYESADLTISLSDLAIAAILGIVLNAVLPGNDYEFDNTEKGEQGLNMEV